MLFQRIKVLYNSDVSLSFKQIFLALFEVVLNQLVDVVFYGQLVKSTNFCKSVQYEGVGKRGYHQRLFK